MNFFSKNNSNSDQNEIKNLDNYQLQIVDYLINVENFKPYTLKDDQKNDVAYLFNLTSKKFQIICISKQRLDNQGMKSDVDSSVLEQLVNKLKSESNRASITILEIFINVKQNKVTNILKPRRTLVYVTPKLIVPSLQKIFPNIVNFIRPVDDIDKSDLKESLWTMSSDLIGNSSQTKSDAATNTFRKKLASRDFIGSWIMVLILIGALVFNYALSEAFNINISLILYTNLNLIFGAKQIWRILTYAFTMGSDLGSLIIGLIFTWLLYFIAKETEVFFQWWRLLIIWFCGIIFTGFIGSLFWNDLEVYGNMYIIWITLGATVYISFAKHNLYTTFFVKKLFFVYLIAVIDLLAAPQGITVALVDLVAFFAGASFALIVGYKGRKLNFNVYISPCLLAALLITGAVGQSLTPLMPFDVDSTTTITLKMMEDNKLIKKGTTSNVCQNYFKGTYDSSTGKCNVDH